MTEDGEPTDHELFVEQWKARMQSDRPDAGLYAIAYAIDRLSDETAAIHMAIMETSDCIQSQTTVMESVIGEDASHRSRSFIRTVDIGRNE